MRSGEELVVMDEPAALVRSPQVRRISGCGAVWTDAKMCGSHSSGQRSTESDEATHR